MPGGHFSCLFVVFLLFSLLSLCCLFVVSMPTFPRSEMLTVVFVRNTRMQKYYGCGEHVRHNITDIPPAPWDIVLTRK